MKFYAAFSGPLFNCYALLVTESETRSKVPENAGLCSTCMHARAIQSERGSVFILCELSLRDPRFPKYPRLPVLTCDGYQKKA